MTSEWVNVNFDAAFAETPALLTGVQSMANQVLTEVPTLRMPWIVPAVKNLGNTSFKLSLDRCEAQGGAVALEETIGYIALTPGHGVCKKTSCYNAEFSVQHALTSGHNMGWDDRDSNLETVTFPEHFDNDNVIAVASKATRNGIDGGWMRIVDANRREVKVIVDEDTSNDADRSHTSEDVAVVAFSQAFVF